MILFRNVNKSYLNGQVKVFDDLNLAIESGNLVTLLGKSGCGKSTLLSMLIGNEFASDGTVKIDNIDVSELNANELQILRRKIGMVFQDFKLLQNRTAEENVRFALEVTGIDESEARKVALTCLKIVDLEDKANRFPSELSGGEQQRVAIARALIHSPRLFLADEPTGNLDAENTRDVINLLKKINKMGATVIVATHNNDLIEHLGGRLVEIKGQGAVYTR